jgi:hypothetical protein
MPRIMRSRVDANQLAEMRRLPPDLVSADEMAVQSVLPLDSTRRLWELSSFGHVREGPQDGSISVMKGPQ